MLNKNRMIFFITCQVLPVLFYQIIMALLFDFQVAADLPFIHESEVDLLNRICRLGSYFQKFQTFCRKYTEVSPFIRESSNDGEHHFI